MRIPQSYIQKVKVVGHVFQALLVFIALCLTISVIARAGPTGGATKFFIALVSGTPGLPDVSLNAHSVSLLSRA